MSETRKEVREKTSIKIKPNVWQEAKIQAIKDCITVSELVEEAIEKYVKERGKK